MTEKHAAHGIRVIYADSVYGPAQDDFERSLRERGYPASSHGALFDTSYMLYVCGSDCVRMDVLPEAVGDPVPARGQRRDPSLPRVNNGISGDARRSTAELGKELFELRVKYAVSQIRRELGKS